MDAHTIRARNDIDLFAKLKRDSFVQQVSRQLEISQNQESQSIRRQLLATSVRLTPTIAPEINKLGFECSKLLGLEIPIEIYTYPSAQFNAACVKPEDGRLFIMFSSSLLEAFEESELRFVMGHELGHHLYGHHDIPISFLLNGSQKPPPELTLELFAWSRYAEISADRAGAHCAQDLEAVARSLFKLASGLAGNLIRFNLDEFISQVDDMQSEVTKPGQSAPIEDWFSTHPFSPLRVRALQLYHESRLTTDDGMSLDLLESEVHKLMNLMEPSYLESQTTAAEMMRRLLFSGTIAVATVSDGISQAEIEMFEKFFGEGSFTDTLDTDLIKDRLDQQIVSTVYETSRAQCSQVIRDLCLVARADGYATPDEVALLKNIAKRINVRPSFVDRCLEAVTELD